ncbi:MAG: PKD domain-containing protein [Crocinitomicaceae bacterium]|nr:PKD domain-containing protein [Crocinitomicaceae bacterium]
MIPLMQSAICVNMSILSKTLGRFALFMLLATGGLFIQAENNKGIAAHAMGGEIVYEYLGNGDFEISLIFYRECFGNEQPFGWQNGGTNLDPQIQLGIFEGNSEFNTYTVDIDVSTIEPLETILENPCGNLPEDLCMQRLEYSITVNLPPSAVGYDLVFQRCCRNPGISNLPNPGNIGITLTTQIPAFVDDSNPNSSPIFNTFPPEAICTNFDFFLDQGATDADGDSLSYAFCTPLNGGSTDNPSPAPSPAATFNEIPWGAGFGALDPIPSAPPFEIDSETGAITGFPTNPGAYVIGICVSEYRDGELLSTVMRDFQFNVVMCDPTIISAAQPQSTDQYCIGETIEFFENSIGAQDLLWDFGVEGIDTDISLEGSPTYTYPDTGTYEVMLIANPSWPCADTSSQVFYIYEPIELEIELNDFACLNGVEAFDLSVNGAFTSSTNITWTFPGGLPSSSNLDSPGWVTFANEENWNVTAVAEHYGCVSNQTFEWIAPADPFADIADQSSFCEGYTFDFDNLSANGESWEWDFGVTGNDDFSSEESPTFTYPYPGIFDVELIVSAPYTCSDTAFATVEIFPEIDPAFEIPDPECFSTNNFSLSPIFTNQPETQYSWDFGGEITSADIANASVNNLSYAAPGTYTVEVTATANGCDVVASEEIWVIEDPSINFQAGPAAGCPPHSVSFVNNSVTETATSYEWQFGDGTVSVAASPNHIYETSGNFSVTLLMNAGGFCSQELILTQNNLIQVLPVPQAGFDITPNQVDILDPTVSYESVNANGLNCFYNFGDGGSSTDCSGNYTYSDGGLFEVTQTVINSAGCSSSATGEVAVSGNVFYAPNSFTPNNDGVNDVWIPVALGITYYNLQIFNRWGELIWTTIDSNEPWLGNSQSGAYYVPDGLYHYQVKIEDQLKYPRTYSGSIQLIR